MPHLLAPGKYALLRSFLPPLAHHLALEAMLAGQTPARVYVDDLTRPQAVLAWIKHRCFLFGSPDNETFADGLRELFRTTLLPEIQTAGHAVVSVYYAPDRWQAQLAQIIPDRDPVPVLRQYYALELATDASSVSAPDGFSLEPVNAQLLARKTLGHLEQLEEELCSERPTVDDFLRKSFGVCMLHGDELAGWCLSEYNCGGCCEVGIETVEEYRRRGLGTTLTRALVRQAQSQGIHRIGWHCIARNAASAATACSAGFIWQCDYPTVMVWIDPMENLAVNGNVLLWDARYAEALVWFERAFAAGTPAPWMYWRGARAAAGANEPQKALDYLGHAIARGFGDVEELLGSECFASLHAQPAWGDMVAALRKRRAYS